MTIDFKVERIDPVTVDGPDHFLSRELMSPFVWSEPDDAGYHMLVRAVPAGEGRHRESGRIWYGRGGSNGVHFRMSDTPVLVPTQGGKDEGGCEDPTVVRTDDGYVVYYTGVDAGGKGHMLYATGQDVRHLEKKGVALPNSRSEKNSKEATLLRSDGIWRLLYEYSHDGHSRIGLADGDGPKGPWSDRPDPIEARPGKWDGYHLSTGPLWRADPTMPVMFYNGATEDADWGIGWVAFTPDLTGTVARSDSALISAPTDVDGPRDIAFAASLIDCEGTLWLYYSRNDRELRRATIRRS